MCLEVRDRYKCLHKGPTKGFDFCIWHMRVTHMPGVEQSTMTYGQNISRCESASTERYDYLEDVCLACKDESEKEENELLGNIGKQKGFRAKERAELMRRDYDHSQNMAREQARIDQTYAEFKKKQKETKDKNAIDMRESAERQYRAQGLSQQRISQLLWSDEERIEWERKEEERLAQQRGMEMRERERRENKKEEKSRKQEF